MERIHKLTEEFMLTAGQTVRQVPSIPTVEEMKLRLTLEFEELKEKAQGMGLEGSFAIIVGAFVGDLGEKIRKEDESVGAIYTIEEYYDRLKRADTGVVNLVEVFDAALDQRVVASGTDLAFGFQHIIEAGDIEVHRSNMSKFDDNWDEANLTHNKYTTERVDVHGAVVNGKIVTMRLGDNKILKSHNYSPADLKGIVQIGEFETK